MFHICLHRLHDLAKDPPSRSNPLPRDDSIRLLRLATVRPEKDYHRLVNYSFFCIAGMLPLIKHTGNVEVSKVIGSHNVLDKRDALLDN